jgi:hypothetical protein
MPVLATKSVCLAVATLLSASPDDIEGFEVSGHIFATVTRETNMTASGRCIQKREDMNLQTGELSRSSWISTKKLESCDLQMALIRIINCPNSLDMGKIVDKIQLENNLQISSITCDFKESSVGMTSAKFTYAELDWRSFDIKRFWTDGMNSADSFPTKEIPNVCSMKNTVETVPLREKAKDGKSIFPGAEYDEWFPNQPKKK